MITLRQKIGQMLIMGFQGTQINEESSIKKWLLSDGLGGVLLFDEDVAQRHSYKNLVHQKQIIQLNQELGTYTSPSGLPLLIAVDYEGGKVDRLKNISGCMTTLSPAQLAALSERDFAVQANQMAHTLKTLGFNLNFAPVVDLNLNDQEGILGKLGRCFSTEAPQTVAAAKRFVKIFADYGIICCYKHFPGHGSAKGDTHHGFVDVTETFQFKELEPYYALLTSEPQFQSMVMTAHVINKQLDPSGLPATLSHTILTGLLRKEIGFEGVIISDDMQMSAISNYFSMEEALRLTINAGADMLIFANQLDTISATTVIDTIERLVLTNKITNSQIEHAYQRIVRLKRTCIPVSQMS